ncbi:hypothetical protein DMN91_007240 [Ooceraea biroi]|uniref:Ionotropic glutamate receptor C-terminal domain-containing protein n=1 Tax=Ooceraea biroi TaxID=2015173 RepID=A0A026X2Y2_OOCBI|nr:uncharacterized protein LOC105284915 [Ooceraea biroi]EZA62625.1 hypothetical protein X777_07439 [Ooceraea biroi]RLU20627.1 hypothetical protein DMN91_007240 [Ooceraea biroi]
MHNVKFGSFDFNRSQNYPHRLLFVTLMFTICVIVIPLRGMADRSIILRNFLKRSNQQSDASARLASCMTTFISEYFEDPDHMSLLLPQVLRTTSGLVETLLKKLHGRSSTVYTLDVRLTDTMLKYEISPNVIILSESVIALEKSDFSFMNYYKHDCNLVIALTNPFVDEESFLNDVGALTQGMRLRSIPKLAILASVEEAVLFADSLAVRIGKSYAPAKPRLLGRCGRRSAANAIRWSFADKTESWPVASTINAAIFDNFPYAFITKDNAGRPIFGGIEGSMVEEIVRSMNIELKRKVINWTDNSTIQEELDLRLLNASDDLVFGGCFRYPHLETQYTVSYGIVYVTWMVPTFPNVSLRGLIASFNPSVWYAIICTFIVGGLAKFLIRDISILNIAALVLGVSLQRQPARNSSRIQFISWTLFGFFLTQFYLGSLADQLIRTSDEQLNTMEELVDSGLMLGGLDQYVDLLKTSNDTDEHEKIMRTIYDKYILFEKDVYAKQFLDLEEGENSSLALLVTLNLTSIHQKSRKHVHIIDETVVSYPLALGTWKGFPYLKEFNFKIQALIQAGFINFWAKKAILYSEDYYEKPDEEEDNKSTLDLNDIAPAFLLLIIGYLGGICLLIMEVIFYPSRILM